MSSDVVQTVAKAIGRQITGGEVSLGKRHDGSENGWIQAARAAVGAMREPTEAMNLAGCDEVRCFIGRDGEMEPDAGTRVWQEMIDAALK